MQDVVVVGCGYAGVVSARILAEKYHKKVLILEKRKTIAGNMYDYKDEHGILVHKYGPHISVMNEESVYSFLSQYTNWIPYEHHVNAEIDGVEVPLPFNLHALEILFEKKKGELLKTKLIEQYGFGNQVPILKLQQEKDADIAVLADYIYKKIFLDYTEKMWGIPPTQLDPTVTGRIPVRISYDNRHFLHKIQVMPENGFTCLFEKMLAHPNIQIQLNCDAKSRLRLDFDTNQIYLDNCLFHGDVIYTGEIDSLAQNKFGKLPYRSLKFRSETLNKDFLQNTPVLNWPDKRPATRRTEMKLLTQQKVDGVTTLITEYPGTYDEKSEDYSEPYYPIINEDNMKVYHLYKHALSNFCNLHLLGRLAEYRYYNMESVIASVLSYISSRVW